MNCDLERVFGELAARLPENEGSPVFELRETNVPVAPAELTTDRVCIRRCYLQRLPGCRGDHLDIIAPPSTFRQLGLLLLSVLFHEETDRSVIHLLPADSQVKHIVTEYKHGLRSQVSGYRYRPWDLRYVPKEIEFVFKANREGLDAPLLRLTNIADQYCENDWEKRDVLHWAGRIVATAEIAKFLLNAGRKTAKQKGWVIPSNGAFFTAEAWLWTPEEWEDMQRGLAEAGEHSRRHRYGGLTEHE
ncbi:MAG TPA: hypothetical protein VJA94_02360 [Candidatus Angelobacter sp.]